MCNGHDAHDVDAGDEDADEVGGNAGGDDQYHDDNDNGEPAILDSGLKQSESQQSCPFSLFHCYLQPEHNHDHDHCEHHHHHYDHHDDHDENDQVDDLA